MNERIKELALQAGMGPWGIGNGYEPDGIVEKFAELIVGECMDLAWAEQKRYANITHRNMSECAVALGNFSLLIKDHFEVEE